MESLFAILAYQIDTITTILAIAEISFIIVLLKKKILHVSLDIGNQGFKFRMDLEYPPKPKQKNK